MTTLTDSQITYLRTKSGDLVQPYTADTALMQVYYDLALDSYPDTALAATIVSVLEDRWAAVQPGVARVTDFGTSVDESEFNEIKRLLDYWRAKAGVYDAASLGVGTLSLGLDSTTDNLTVDDGLYP